MNGWTRLFWIILTSFCFTAYATDQRQLDMGLLNPGYEEKPGWFKNSFLDLREDVAEAGTRGKRVMLYFYQDGCPYCKKLLEDNFGQQEISEKAQKYFDVIAINLWGDNEVVDLQGNETTEKEFSKSLKVMYTPTLLFLNEKADVVLRINGYFAPHKFLAALDFVGKKPTGYSRFQDYLSTQKLEPASGKLHVQPGYVQPPYRLAERLKLNTKPLIVMFEQKQCRVCDELHLDVLERDVSKKLLKKFDIVLLNMWSKDNIQTPDRRELTIAAWANELNINYAPSMIFFDFGKEVFRIEAYLKAFHIQSALEYVASGAYHKEPEFQRYINVRADALRAKGEEVNVME